MITDPWVVNIKGSPGDYFEISVLRSSNSHGMKSHGWFGKDKILISSSGGPCSDRVPKMVWDRLVRVAEETALDLNAIPTELVEGEVLSLK